jgi:hypothetical protein
VEAAMVAKTNLIQLPVNKSTGRTRVIGYMCGVDFDTELGLNADGNRVFPSVKALKRAMSCWKSCGIVEVEVRARRMVVKQDLLRGVVITNASGTVIKDKRLAKRRLKVVK